MSKQATLFVFCGLVAATLGQNLHAGQTIGGIDSGDILGNHAPTFLGGDQLNAHGTQSALNSVRDAATEQATRVECQDRDLELDAFGCGGENEWDCTCNDGIIRVPQSRWSRTVIEALTNQTIPLQSVATNTTETIDRCFENNQAAERNINQRAAFSYSGNLNSHTWDVQQSCLSEEECFSETGCADYDFNQHSEDIGADCECKAISSANRGDIDTNCDCDCIGCDNNSKQSGHSRSKKTDNPDKDIEDKVSREVEKAISDVLSGIFQRCISSSMDDCLSIVNH